jgi:hypothetical protein
VQAVASRQFKTAVLGLALSCKGHIAVCLSDRIFWFKFLERGEAPKEVPTSLNPEGMFAISDDGHLLAYPAGPNLIGIRHGNEELARIVTDGPCCKLRFNPKGAGQDLLAGVAEGGKTVWVWGLQRNEQKATLKWEFTRSRAKQCQVQGVDFNALSTLLALSTDSGTIHVFELSERNQLSSGGYFGSVTSWIPSVVVPSVTSKYKVECFTVFCASSDLSKGAGRGASACSGVSAGGRGAAACRAGRGGHAAPQRVRALVGRQPARVRAAHRQQVWRRARDRPASSQSARVSVIQFLSFSLFVS